MDQATLVSPDITAGSEALAALDAAGIKRLTALFILQPEYEDWRLVLSSPSLDMEHQLKAYEKVARILGGRFVYTLPPMLVLRTKDPFIRDLRRTFASTSDTYGMRLGGQMFGGKYLEDAFVYRIR